MDEFDEAWQEEFSPGESNAQNSHPEPPSDFVRIKSSTEDKPSPYLDLANTIDLLNLRSIAKRPESLDKWLPSHRALLEQGVRAGNCYSTPEFISVVGYTKQGFLFVPRTGSLSSGKFRSYRDKTIRKKIAAFPSPNFRVVPALLDEDGFAKPGQELNVTLASFPIVPSVWDFDASTQVYISFCSAGHYVFSEYPIPFGQECKGSRCLDTQYSEAAQKFLETLIEAIATNSPPISGRLYKTSPLVTQNSRISCCAPFLDERVPRPTLEKKYTSTISPEQIVDVYSDSNNEIYPMMVKTYECGYTHFESLSGEYGKGPFHFRIPENISISLAHRCPKCDKPGLIFPLQLKSKEETTTHNFHEESSLVSGEVILNLKKQYPITIRNVSKDKAIGYTSKKQTVILPRLIDKKNYKRISRDDKFFTENGLLKTAPVNLSKWIRAITAGTRLQRKRNNQLVTCLTAPIRISNTWLISILEDSKLINLVTDLKLPKDPAVRVGDILCIQQESYKVVSLNDPVILRKDISFPDYHEDHPSSISIPYLGFSILFELDFVRHSEKILYTVESLMKGERDEGKSTTDGRR